VAKSTTYQLRPQEGLALRAIVARSAGVCALLLEGAPGCGKTAFGEHVASVLKAELLFCQLHSWSDDQELFCGVNIPAAIGGDADNVRQKGVLWLAALASQKGPVVVLLDELDKAPENVEHLLLDVLQAGRVPTAPGQHERLVIANTVFVITSNGARDHGDALLRRVRRVRMATLPIGTFNQIVVERTGASPDIVAMATKIGHEVARKDDQIWSVQEACQLVGEFPLAHTFEDLTILFTQWAARGPLGVTHCEGRQSGLPRLWGELVRRRRGL